MQSIDIYRGSTLLTTVKFDASDSCTQRKVMMGENTVSLSFKDSKYIPFLIGDWCEVFGETYKINKLPGVVKSATVFYEYTMTLEASSADLAKAQYFGLGNDNTLKEPDFSLMGTAGDFMNLLLQNMARIATGWNGADVTPTGYKNLTFSKENCFNALSKIAEAFGLEWHITGKTISLAKKSKDAGRLFKQGQHRGLYTVTRQNIDSSDVATRIYVYGAEKNLPPNYPAKRLMLPGAVTMPPANFEIKDVAWSITDNGDGTQTIVLAFVPPTGQNINALTVSYSRAGVSSSTTGGNVSPKTLTLPLAPSYDLKFTVHVAGGQSYTTDVFTVTTGAGMGLTDPPPRVPYIERNTQKYGIIEGIVTFDDIYPHRTGKVTATDATDIFVFSDSTMDFNLNQYLLPGIAAKVTFNTGQLAGYTFDLESYDHTAKRFRYLRNKDEKALEVPSEFLKPAIGDTYVLTDIYLPIEYIDAAEAELQAKAEELLETISEPQVSYRVEFDPTHLRRERYIPQLGELNWIADNDFGFTKKMRVVETTRDLSNEWQIDVVYSDIVAPGKLERIISAGTANAQNIQQIENFINNRDVFEGKMSLPEITDTTGLWQVWIEPNSGKMYKKRP